MTVGSVLPCIPVPVHQVVDHPAIGKLQIRVKVLCGLVHLYFPGIEHFPAIRGKHQPGDASFHLRDLVLTASVGIHFPGLQFPRGRGYINDLFPVGMPDRVEFVLRGAGKLYLFAAVGIHHEKFPVTLVLFNGIITDPVQDLFSVGTHLHIPQPAKGPEDFRGHDVGFEFHFVLHDQGLIVCFFNRGLAGGQDKGRQGHKCDLFHEMAYWSIKIRKLSPAHNPPGGCRDGSRMLYNRSFILILPFEQISNSVMARQWVNSGIQ